MSETTAGSPAVFLDRDGTISEEVGYLNHPSRFRMFPFAAAAIRRLNEAALPVIVVTNQAGIKRGYFPESLVQTVHDRMTREIADAGGRIDGIYYCPHVAEDACDCRKPKTGMLDRAAREHTLDLKRSFVVGDQASDIQVGFNAGMRSILVRTGYGEGEYAWRASTWAVQPDYVAATLTDAVDWILRQQR